MGQEPLKNLPTARSELCIYLTHIFNRQRKKLTVPVLLKLLNSHIEFFIVELKVFTVEGFWFWKGGSIETGQSDGKSLAEFLIGWLL